MKNDIVQLRTYYREVRVYMREAVDWSLKSLGVPDLWRQTQGEGITVAILDTGVDTRHPDLLDAIVDEKDFTRSPVGAYDRIGHGTHVAGIIGARMNSTGIIGLAPKVKILNAKVINDDGSGSSDNVVKAIEWAIEKKADVINLSLGTPYQNAKLEEATRIAAGKKIILVAAAGNYGSSYFDTVNYPAKYEHVISVGSVDQNLLRSRFSATGKRLDVMAPGEEVFSCFPMGLYARMSGTSMSTPFVSGVVALCLSKHRDIGGDTPCENYIEMREHLQKTATDLGADGPDRFYGYGLINPGSFLK